MKGKNRRRSAKIFLLLGLLLLPFLGWTGVIELMIDAPVAGLGTNWPMYVGVPMPRGVFGVSNAIVVCDDQGTAVPSQHRVLATWTTDGSVRWLGIDFRGDPSRGYSARFGEDLVQAAVGSVITVVEDSEGWVVDTGVARFLITESGPLIRRAWLESDGVSGYSQEELLISNEDSELYVVDQHGKTAWAGMDAEADSFVMEPALESGEAAGGLQHFAIRREGWYTAPLDEDRLARHITRLHFYAGQPFVRIEHTLVLSRNTNPSFYVDRYNPGAPVWFREIGIRFKHNLPQQQEVRFNNDHADGTLTTNLLWTATDEALYMFQEKSFFFSRTDEEQDCRFTIGRDKAGGTVVEQEGGRCGNWLDVTGGGGGVSLTLRNLWQQYPKELRVTTNSVAALLWSGRGGRELDFHFATLLEQWPTNWLNYPLHGDYGNAYGSLMDTGTNQYALGLAKTHELLLNLHAAADTGVATAARAFERPAVVLADPRWLYLSEVMSPLHPADTNRFALLEAFSSTYFNQYKAVFEEWGDYGFLDFGNRPHVWYRKLNSPGHALHNRWYPYLYRYSALIDYGFSGHLWRMYARSGNREYLDLAEETNRQRMDIAMVHWDGPKISFTKANGFMVGKYKGGFSSSYAIIPWSLYTTLHHNSGTELRHLYWHYYLRDYRRAHDVAEEYHELVKKLWTGGAHSPFTSTRPFATLKNLGTLYQETGDPLILEIGRQRLPELVDLDVPQGVSPTAEATVLGKYTTKIGAIERWYEATGDELAAQAILRGAYTYARNSIGDHPHAYYNVWGRVLNRAYRISGDNIFARTLKRNMELAVDLYYDPVGDSWDNTLGKLTISASNSAYPMGDMAIGMDAVVRAGDIGPVPMLRQQDPNSDMLAIFRKDADEVTFDIRSPVPINPLVLTMSGEVVTGLVLEPVLEQIESLEPNYAPNSFIVRVPADIPAGDYVISPGVDNIAWEVTWSDAPGLVFFAPNGIKVGKGPEWYFYVPEGRDSIEVFNGGNLEIRDPSGLRVAQDGFNSWRELPITGGGGEFWSVKAREVGSHFEYRGGPAILANDTNRWYVPDIFSIPPEGIQQQATYYVWGDNPTPQAPYQSWQTAANTIQDAVDLAQDGEVVLVAPGFYNSGGRVTPGGTLTNRVCATRKISILSVAESPDFTIIKGSVGDGGDFGANAARCVYLDGGALLSGFTLMGGYTHTNNADYLDSAGGGAFVTGESIISNCVIISNNAAFNGGGAVCYEGGVVSGCEVAYNDTRSAGGGVSCYFGGRVENSEIHDNYAYNNNKPDGQGGGGIYAFSSGTKNPMTITNCFIYNNETKGPGGAIYFTRGPTEIVDCVISNNHARRGGGVWANISGSIIRCTIVENTTTHASAVCGGGAYIYYARMEHSVVARNYAAGDAGGVYAYSGSSLINNCLIVDNIAGRNYGGALIGVNTTLKNCTIADNMAIKGDVGGMGLTADTSALHSTIVWGNSGENLATTAEPTISHVCGAAVPGVANIEADPMFMNPGVGDYRLRSSSPCIDSGLYEGWMEEGKDLDGKRRIRGAGVDRGAYEHAHGGIQLLVR